MTDDIENIVRELNEFAAKIAQALIPPMREMQNAMNELIRAAAASRISGRQFDESFQSVMRRIVKKSRHRRRYFRMMSRIKK